VLRSKIGDASASTQIIEYIYILKTLEVDRDYEKIGYIVSELTYLQSEMQNNGMKIDIHDHSELIRAHDEVIILIQELMKYQENINNHLIMMKKNQYCITTYVKNQR
jgi:hypothetical protein